MAPPAVLSPFSTRAEAPRASRRQPVTCVLARSSWERALHLDIRAEVFVREQAVFAGSDRDDHDEDPATRHGLGLVGRLAVGTVRFYPLPETGVWRGDRLAVLASHRGHHVGGPLVRFAVRTAAAAGGTRMLAHIQPPNVAFFTALGWQPDGGVVDYVGLPHQPMSIDLTSVRVRAPGG